MHKKIAQYDGKITTQGKLEEKDNLLNYIKRYDPTTNKHEIVFQDQLDREKL